MGLFERYLSIWITISIVSGIVIGSSMPGIFTFISAVELFHVNIVIAILIWLMIYPMMSQVDLSAIKGVGQNSRGMILTLIFNWLIKPITMAALGWIFLKIVFSPWFDIQSSNEYISGMILCSIPAIWGETRCAPYAGPSRWIFRPFCDPHSWKAPGWFAAPTCQDGWLGSDHTL